MLNYIPIIGWCLSLLFNTSLAIPFWFFWTRCQLGSKFFYWLPDVYKAVSFWDCVGLFIVISILKGVLIPKIVEVEQNNKADK